MAGGAALKFKPLPADFASAFVELGRHGCEDEYGVGRTTIERWLSEIGRDELLAKRAQYVTEIPNWGETRSRPIRSCPPDFDGAYAQLGSKGCERRYGVGWRTICRWREERGRDRLETLRARYLGRRITVLDIGRVISRAYPIEHAKLPSLRDDANTKLG